MRRRRFLLSAVALAGSAVLFGCATEVQRHEFPKLSFAHMAPIVFDVAQVQVVSDYRPPMSGNNVEHRLPLSPEAAIRAWVGDRIKAEGAGGTVLVVIKNAAVTETKLETDRGVGGLFKKEQSERYDGAAEVLVRVLDNGGTERGFVSGQARAGKTVREDMTLNQRETVQFELVEALVKTLDAEVERNIRMHLAPYLR